MRFHGFQGVSFHGVRRVRQLGDYGPGTTDPTIEDVQTALNTIGFHLIVHGVYDDQTGEAVLEFRDATGLPHVNRIDEQFQSRLYDEVDRVLGTDKPPATHPVGPVVRMDPIYIEGKLGGAALVGLLILGALVYKRYA